MRFSRSIFALAALTALAAAPSGAQYVALDGSYGEANGQIVDIPNNQPQQFLATGCEVNSRCRGYKKVFPTQMASTIPQTNKRPVNGVARQVPLQTIVGGLGVGASFKIPASFFGQNPQNGPGLPGIGAGPVLQNAVQWISTAYYARMPGAKRGSRLDHPNLPPQNALTRVMRAQPAGAIPGQTGRDLDPTQMTVNGAKRIIHPMDNLNSNDSGTVIYTEGPNRFGGVMTALLDGYSDLHVYAFGAFDAYVALANRPAVAIQRAGDYDVTAMGNPHLSLMTRNGAGWNVPINGGQGPAPLFGPVATIGGAPCEPQILPPTPLNCNKPAVLPIARPELGTRMTVMGAVFPAITKNPLGPWNRQFATIIPAANSVKYNFPFTTGTVTLVVNAQRVPGGTWVETLTGMGHDTVTAMGQVRNVGLVAGSYTNRASGSSANQLNFQLLGVDLQLTPVPEVASATALAAGVALLGFAARRRR